MRLTTKNDSSQGMALVIVMVLVLGVTMVLASLTAMVNQSNYLAARTQAWNECIPVAEAGVEDALSLMRNDETLWGWTNNLTTNGWSAFASGVTKVKRSLDGSSYYVVSIDVSSGLPKIDSIGYVNFLGSHGATTELAREVEITTTNENTKMTMGLICSNAISLSGNVLIDSFDSSTNTGSTGGIYDPAKARDNVTVATASTSAKAIQANGSCRIWGNLETGPGGGAVMTGVARAGSKSYVGSSGGWPPGVEDGHINQDFLFQYPDVTPLATPAGGLPATFASLPTTKLNGTTYTVSDANNLGTYNSYQFSSLSVKGSGTNPYLINGAVTNVVNGSFGTTANGYMVINANSTYALYATGGITLSGGPPWINGAANSITIGPNCNVLMYTPGDFTITASGRLYIDPSSHLTIYAGGNITLSGAGLINTATANNLTVYGLPTCNSITVTASANFIGTIYAPSADVTISGASPFFGSCICRSANLAGSGVFHYDEALKSSSSSSTFYINRWRELAFSSAGTNPN